MKAIAGIGKCGCVLAGAIPDTPEEQKRYEKEFKSQGLRIEYRDSVTLEIGSHSYGYCEKIDKRIKELEGLLKECEWSDRDDYYEESCCPICGAIKSHGHIVNCKLQAALKEG